MREERLMLRWTVLGLCLAGALSFSACGGGSGEQPIAVVAGGAGEVVTDVQVPGDGWTIRVEFQDIRSDWDATANWRVTVYDPTSRQAVAYVNRGVTTESQTIETWVTRKLPGSGKPASALANNSSARFSTGLGSFQVGISLSGFQQWRAIVVVDPPATAPL